VRIRRALRHGPGADAPALPLTQVDVSNLATAQSETMVAVDPSNPKVLLAGSNNESLLVGTLAYTSTDGGATWVTSRPWALDPKDFQCSVGDPVTAIDDRGRQLIGYIVIPCLAGERVQRLSLYVSRRESATAPWTVTRVPAPTGPNGPANDKPAIAWDVSTASPHHGRVYLTWTRLKRTEISVVLS